MKNLSMMICFNKIYVCSVKSYMEMKKSAKSADQLFLKSSWDSNMAVIFVLLEPVRGVYYLVQLNVNFDKSVIFC